MRRAARAANWIRAHEASIRWVANALSSRASSFRTWRREQPITSAISSCVISSTRRYIATWARSSGSLSSSERTPTSCSGEAVKLGQGSDSWRSASSRPRVRWYRRKAIQEARAGSTLSDGSSQAHCRWELVRLMDPGWRRF